MKILLLNITDKTILDSLRKLEILQITNATISNPALYPFPQIVIIDFEKTIQFEKNERVLTDIAFRIAPPPRIVAFMEKWDNKHIELARSFGINTVLTYGDPNDYETLKSIICQ